jgi:dihydroorotase
MLHVLMRVCYSAPHAVHTKEAPCGCAGVYSAPIALPLYATAFEQVRPDVPVH